MTTETKDFLRGLTYLLLFAACIICAAWVEGWQQ